MKILYLLFGLIILYIPAFSQKKWEAISISWPAEYHWKEVKHEQQGNLYISMIIPGSEEPATASIIGSLSVYHGNSYPSLDEMEKDYRSRMDTGTTMTVVERHPNGKHFWTLFKVETPVINKYPEPESDLYYVIQGDYGVYENYVGIRKPALSDDFVQKWSEIFKSAELKMLTK